MVTVDSHFLYLLLVGWSIKKLNPFYFFKVSVEAFFEWGRKRLHYFVANLFKTPDGRFYRNRQSLTEMWRKRFGSIFRTRYWSSQRTRPLEFYKVLWRHYPGDGENTAVTNILRDMSTSNCENRTIFGGVIWKTKSVTTLFMDRYSTVLIDTVFVISCLWSIALCVYTLCLRKKRGVECQGSHAPGKSWIFWVQFPGPGKSWKFECKVLESPGIF